MPESNTIEHDADYQKRKAALTTQYEAYVYKNPALKHLLHDFITSV
jgi:hypothetical protein